MPDRTAAANLLRPKLVTMMSEGYSAPAFRKDLLAALTVAIVALPLSMAIAVASGVTPERGLYTTIVGGFLVSALGGSRYQIGGPAGAFIVLVAATNERFGLDGLLLAVLMSGVLITLIGFARLGSLIRYMPAAVTVGFTAGIAIIIFASQIRDFLGIHLPGAEPGPLIPKLTALTLAASTANPITLGIGVATTAAIVILRHHRPSWPSLLIVIVAASALTACLDLPVDTIGTRFGGIPGDLPVPHLPDVSAERLLQLLPAALSFTLLGSIESLLSAKVADGMTARVHRSNMELVAQGVANVASAFFGGISVTGTIARTATNVRAGAYGPVSGMMHALVVLVFMMAAAPLARFIPLSALAGVLLTVCWNMIERPAIARLLRDWRNAAVLLTTFGVTLAEDLTAGIVAGCLVAATLHLLEHWPARKGTPTGDR